MITGRGVWDGMALLQNGLEGRPRQPGDQARADQQGAQFLKLKIEISCSDVDSREPGVHGSFSAHDDGRPCTFSQVFVLAMLEENIHD